MDTNLYINTGLQIPLDEVLIRTSRSSGPGGQHANVPASRVEVSVDIQTCAGLSDWQRARLQTRFGPRVVASSQDTRSQMRNRELALARLAERIRQALVVQAPRRPTRPSRSSAKKRLDSKRQRGQLKRGRGDGSQDGY